MGGAGTNPTHSASLLRLAPTADRSHFEFTASAEREFTVQFTTNLLSPWTDLTPTSSGTVQLALTNASGFYRVRARLP